MLIFECSSNAPHVVLDPNVVDPNVINHLYSIPEIIDPNLINHLNAHPNITDLNLIDYLRANPQLVDPSVCDPNLITFLQNHIVDDNAGLNANNMNLYIHNNVIYVAHPPQDIPPN